MPPVKTVASTTDVDNEATAELPVLDVAAYEATLNDSIASTDTWNLPAVPDATAQMPALAESIPTLRPADDLADLSGTHEMPAFSRPNKVVRATQVPTPTVTVHTAPPSPIIEELRAALAAAERRIVELNEWARIADAERSVAVARAAAENAQLREQLSHHLETLSTARARRDVKRADEPGLEDELFMRADRIVTLDKELALRAAELASVRAMLAATQARESRLESDVSNLRTALERRDQQIAALTADLSARQERETQLAERLEHAVAASNPDVPALRAEIADREEQIQSLKAELGRARTAAAERNADLEAAEESIRNLEIEVRDKSGKLDEATHTVEEWRAVIAESQKSILQRDTRIQQLQADLDKKLSSTLDTAAQTGEEVALEGPARVLIRTDGNTDFVHVLGRRTRIGRGSDNELVLDTKHVSRYHAVLLAGPVHTSIEDLNSTNGVFVNGKRVARHVLKDGDRVTIGKTHYRFSVRS